MSQVLCFGIGPRHAIGEQPSDLMISPGGARAHDGQRNLDHLARDLSEGTGPQTSNAVETMLVKQMLTEVGIGLEEKPVLW
ncbi:hypothetical protein D3C74_447980 [compost metagenome]